MTAITEEDILALRRLADLMDEDDAHTGKVGIPVSHGHHLLWLSIIGSFDAWDAEWVRLTRTESVAAAIAWSEQQEVQLRRLIELVYPGGATACPKSAAEVRALADPLSAP